ncbi:hypothetical protein [Verrucomicrobium spinosum]|uniref:hypothetical protein n=1 Tax=Verrucomicrobium spinosum TaxID=2736 RepID=UPI0009462696|nr:hypothetical protein [Verrucomicrobium spinosum]
MVEYGEDDSSAFYITENVDGETLRAYLERREDLPARVAVKLAVAVLRVMEGLGPQGDSLPIRALESLRLVQTGPHCLVAVLADYRLVTAKDTAKLKLKLWGSRSSFFKLGWESTSRSPPKGRRQRYAVLNYRSNWPVCWELGACKVRPCCRRP